VRLERIEAVVAIAVAAPPLDSRRENHTSSGPRVYRKLGINSREELAEAFEVTSGA
jgi:hypothetical protein